MCAYVSACVCVCVVIVLSGLEDFIVFFVKIIVLTWYFLVYYKILIVYVVYFD